jgi:hypothetical protein
MYRRRRLEEYLGLANCASAACSCHRPRTGRTWTSSLRQVGQHKERGTQFWSILRTQATPAEAVEQAKAPVTPPIRTNWTIFGVLVAAHLHRRSALKKALKNN